jgi:hypothetical protein
MRFIDVFLQWFVYRSARCSVLWRDVRLCPDGAVSSYVMPVRGNDMERVSCHPRASGDPDATLHRVTRQGVVQVSPFGIEALDQLQFPPALPFLDALLARNGLVDIGVELVPDQLAHAIFASEFAALAGPMLMGADGEVIRHADIQSAVTAARHDVDRVAPAGLHHRVPSF